MSDIARLHDSRSRAAHGATFPHWCDYSGPQWGGATRCAHCGGLLRHVTDTGVDHGPAEGFVSDSGLALESSSNGFPQPGSIRMEQRARELRDIGALRMLARLHDRTGATSAASHCRDLADIFSYSATMDAMPAGADIGEPQGFVGPAVCDAYDASTDMFVEVLHVNTRTHRAEIRSPMGYSTIVSDDILNFGCATVGAAANLHRYLNR